MGYDQKHGLLHRWLTTSETPNGHRILTVSDDEKLASVFTIKGSKYGNIQVSTIFENKKLYWTWFKKPTASKSENEKIYLCEENQDREQDFLLKLDYGESLCAFYVSSEDKMVKFVNDEVILCTARKGEKTVIPYCAEAPCDTTFMIMPQNNETSFYLSLNFMFNSIRFSEENHLIKSDFRLNYIFRDLCENDKVKGQLEKDIVHTCDYCFCLLVKPILSQLTKSMFANNDGEEAKKIFHHFIQTNIQFLIELQKNSEKNRGKKILSSPKDYLLYLEKLKQYFANNRIDGIHILWNAIIESLYFSTLYNRNGTAYNLTLEHLLVRFDSDFFEILKSIVEKLEKLNENIGEKLIGALGVTNDILTRCFMKYDTKIEHSGHMGIIRVSSRQHGNHFKEFLCTARHVILDSKLSEHKFEIIQDYDSKTTLGTATKLNNYVENAIEDAKLLNSPVQLRILKKIQVDDCQKKDKHGVSECPCKQYKPNNKNDYDMKCIDCKHIHRTFESYGDLVGLPCLLILVNNGRMGDTFPLRYD